MSLTPVRRGFWGDRFGAVHTVPAKVTRFDLIIKSKYILVQTHGKCGSVSVRIIPAPRGTGTSIYNQIVLNKKFASQVKVCFLNYICINVRHCGGSRPQESN